MAQNELCTSIQYVLKHKKPVMKKSMPYVTVWFNIFRDKYTGTCHCVPYNVVKEKANPESFLNLTNWQTQIVLKA